MRIETVILVRLQPEQQQALLEAGMLDMDQAMSGAGFIEFRHPHNAPEAVEMIDRLEESGVEHYVYEERHFSTREIRMASFLHIAPSCTLPESGTLHASSYDWSAVCPRCQRVPVQEGHLLADPEAFPEEALIRGRRGELIVHESIAVRMIKEGITGAILREIEVDGQEGERCAQYFQLVPTSKMPNVVCPPTRFHFTEDVCETCTQGGQHLDSLLYYDVPMGDMDDINVTTELFGDGAELSPEIVVSPRFYNLLVSCGAELEATEPVMFV